MATNDTTEVRVINTRSQSQSGTVEVSNGKAKAVKTSTEDSPASAASQEEDAQDSDASDDEDQEDYEDESEDDVDNFTTSVIVTVHVGPKRKCFYLHRNLICERSPFMEKCLSKNRFSEGDKNELYLPEDDPKAFAIVVDWIYRGKLPGMTPGGGFDVIDMSSAYCMADKFGMEELQNGIMDCVRASFRIGLHHAYSEAHNHNHHAATGNSVHSSQSNARDVSRLGIMSSLSSGQAERAAAAAAASPEAARPNYAALSLCHQTGPPKSPLKRFFIEHLVYHMLTFPKWYHNDFTKNLPPAARVAAANNNKTPTPTPTADDARAARDRENFEKLFEISELSLLIMRKIWQWQIERWGDPARDKGCAYHVHSSTQCEYKRAGLATASGAAAAKPGMRAGLSSSPNSQAALLQGLGARGNGQSNWMGGPSAAAAGLIGGWHPGGQPTEGEEEGKGKKRKRVDDDGFVHPDKLEKIYNDMVKAGLPNVDQVFSSIVRAQLSRFLETATGAADILEEARQARKAARHARGETRGQEIQRTYDEDVAEIRKRSAAEKAPLVDAIGKPGFVFAQWEPKFDEICARREQAIKARVAKKDRELDEERERQRLETTGGLELEPARKRQKLLHELESKNNTLQWVNREIDRVEQELEDMDKAV
ncbi:hypothetical protein H2200_004620 [Cladophialophora chaetospira]|uniref:BTB domain-containing protein n=1 Tax=Cladophialophora chaetospira TaxID=386627 RepID=A0AA38XDF8_9EURO|nr:hypothetical protein H2200_004620 [Cladophialophora chaetospira]